MEPFIGEIIMFGGNFAPRGWALCDGQLLAISSNQALFAILGTTYGGDGRTTFGLPDLRSRVPIHPGNGPGLSSYRLGQRGGLETVTLTQNQIPSHTHLATGKIKANFSPTTPANSTNPTDGTFSNAEAKIYNKEEPNAYMAADGVEVTVGNAGGGQYHTNIQPFLGVNYIIALLGTFPSRN